MVAPPAYGICGFAGDPPQPGPPLFGTDPVTNLEFIEEAIVTITRVEVRQGDVDDDSDNGNENDNQNDNGNENENGNDNGNGNGNSNENQNGNANMNDNGNDNDTGDSDDDGPFVVIFDGERDFNLLDLQNGRTDLLANAEVPAGTYTQMRLIVTEGTVVLNDEDRTTFALNVLSGAQSGIKLNFTFDVAADTETTLLLDVDLSRAFSPIPGGRIDDVSTIRNFRFQPSLAMRLINLIDAGAISGTVTDPDANPIESASVTAFEDGAEVNTTSTDSDGSYEIAGLPAVTDGVRLF